MTNNFVNRSRDYYPNDDGQSSDKGSGAAINDRGTKTLITKNNIINNYGGVAVLLYFSNNTSITKNIINNNRGGAISTLADNVIIYNNTINNNIGEYEGGISCVYYNVLIKNNKINNNTANAGSAISFSYIDKINITGNEICYNKAVPENYDDETYPGSDGAILGDDSENIYISNNNINHNTADETGAIGIYESKVTINNNNINYNTATNNTGAILIYYCDALISNNNISYNNASEYGGALNINSSSIIIKNNNLTYNNAIGGGAIRLSYTDAQIIGNVINHNYAQIGGAINAEPPIDSDDMFSDQSSNIIINNNKIKYNTAVHGAALMIQNNNTQIINNDINYNNDTHGYLIDLEESENITVSNNNIKNNIANIGILFPGLRNINITYNTIKYNIAYREGIVTIANTYNSKVLNNIITNNKSLYGPSGAIIKNEAEKYTIKNNSIKNNKYSF
jgi:hypothetical protein